MNKYVHGNYQQEQQEHEEQEVALLVDEEIKRKALGLFMKALLCDSLSALAELVELIKEHGEKR